MISGNSCSMCMSLNSNMKLGAESMIFFLLFITAEPYFQFLEKETRIYFFPVWIVCIPKVKCMYVF